MNVDGEGAGAGAVGEGLPARTTDGGGAPDGDRSAASRAELVEVVDGDGAVLRVTTRAEMRAAGLRHRCTYVAVVTTDGHLVVHQRAAWKDVHPSYWDVCFGGVCGVGEDWTSSARRELAEEAGLTGIDLDDLGPVRHDGGAGSVVGRVFLAVTDEVPTCPDGEVVAVDRVPLSGLDAWLTGRDVCPDSRDAALPLVLARATGR